MRIASSHALRAFVVLTSLVLLVCTATARPGDRRFHGRSFGTPAPSPELPLDLLPEGPETTFSDLDWRVGEGFDASAAAHALRPVIGSDGNGRLQLTVDVPLHGSVVFHQQGLIVDAPTGERSVPWAHEARRSHRPRGSRSLDELASLPWLMPLPVRTVETARGLEIQGAWLGGDQSFQLEPGALGHRVTLREDAIDHVDTFDLRSTFFVLTPPRTELVVAADGRVVLVDLQGRELLQLDVPSLREGLGAEAITDVARWEVESAGAGQVLSLVVPGQWLSDPYRLMPVRLETEMSVQTMLDIAIAPADGMIKGHASFGSVLRNRDGRHFVDFDLATLPETLEIVAGKLRVHRELERGLSNVGAAEIRVGNLTIPNASPGRGAVISPRDRKQSRWFEVPLTAEWLEELRRQDHGTASITVELSSFALAEALFDGDVSVLQVQELPDAGDVLVDVVLELEGPDVDAEGQGCTGYDWEGVPEGTVIDLQFQGVDVDGRTSSGPHAIVTLDTTDPTCGDDDLQTPGIGPGNDTPLGNVLVLQDSEGACQPNDLGHGGVMEFRFDAPSRIDSVTLIDNDEDNSSFRVFTSGGIAINQIVPNGGNGGVQEIPVNLDDVVRIEVSFAGSGGVAGIGGGGGVPFTNCFAGHQQGTTITDQFPGVTISGTREIVIFNSNDPTCGDTDLRTPGVGMGNDSDLGNLLVLQSTGHCRPNDYRFGGTMTFEFDEPTLIDSVAVVDVDEIGGSIRAYDEFQQLIHDEPIVNLDDNSVQHLVIGRCDVKTVQVIMVGSGGIGGFNCR